MNDNVSDHEYRSRKKIRNITNSEGQIEINDDIGKSIWFTLAKCQTADMLLMDSKVVMASSVLCSMSR